jgi:hypothetical protein
MEFRVAVRAAIGGDDDVEILIQRFEWSVERQRWSLC